MTTRVDAREAMAPPADGSAQPDQRAVNLALVEYFDGVQQRNSSAMIRSVACITAATEQQVQRAMRFVQDTRHVTRSELLAVLVGDTPRAAP